MFRYIVTTVLAGILLFVLRVFRRNRERDVAIRDSGCGPVIKHRTKEPFSAFDFHMAMHMDIPLVHLQHQKYGQTFQLRSLVAQPAIMTTAPANIRAINTGKDWGIQPLRLAGMEYFCGRGFLTTDGDIWQHSRKLLKSGFAKENVLDMDCLSRQMDTLLGELPTDGSVVDLQPLFYTTV